MLKSAVALAAALICAPAAAQCERYNVTVTPFEYKVDNSLGWVELGKMAGLRVTFGSIRNQFRVEAQGCDIDMQFKLTMFVAAELAEGTCARDHVVAHEMRHLDVYRQAMVGMADRVAASAVAAGVKDAVMGEMRAIQASNDSIDTPEEYRTNASACGGQVFSLTGQRQR